MKTISDNTFVLLKLWYSNAVDNLLDDPDEVCDCKDELIRWVDELTRVGKDLGLHFWEVAKAHSRPGPQQFDKLKQLMASEW